MPARAVVLGDHEAALGLVGAGAADLFSNPVRPVTLDGHSYVALDFRDAPITLPNPKPGLMGLYGRQIPIDVRTIIGWVRDISAISDDQYQSLPRPTSIRQWPDDLFRSPGLEFSGFYEDGWTSGHALLKLGPSKAGNSLSITGMVPGFGNLAKGNTLAIRIGGRLLATKVLRPGFFHVSVPISDSSPITSVNLDFAVEQNLPKGDDRPVAAHIDTIEIK